MFSIENDPLVNLTNERLHSLGVKALLFDLDDTLIDTDLLFRNNMRSFSCAVASSLGIDTEPILKRLHEINIEEYQRHGVDPQKWSIVLQRLGEELRNVEVVLDNFHYINNIYFEEPILFPGVKPLLASLKAGNFLLGEVTHGETDWSMRKNEQTGILNYFDVIVTASIRGPKTKAHWLQCMDSLSVSPHECIITGDNLKGDIIPAIELGARAISLTSPWSVYREGELPPEAVPLKKISDFWDAVQKLR